MNTLIKMLNMVLYTFRSLINLGLVNMLTKVSETGI